MTEYIDKEQAMMLREPSKNQRYYQTDNLDDVYEQGWDDALNAIEKMPKSDVVPIVHGRWICTNIAYGEYKCSVCEGMDTDCSDCYSNHNVLDQEYCPWCGAKMDEHNEPEN